MKKDRNSFFEGSSMNMSAYNTGMPMMPMMGPMNAQASASQSFYANTPNLMMMPMYQNTNMMDTSTSELESRMAKLERNMNRLENRISKLEGNTYYTTSTDTYESNSSSGMYMV